MKSSVYYCELMDELIVVTQLYAMDDKTEIHVWGEISYVTTLALYKPIGYLLDMGNQPLYLESIEKIRPKLIFVGEL